MYSFDKSALKSRYCSDLCAHVLTAAPESSSMHTREVDSFVIDLIPLQK